MQAIIFYVLESTTIFHLSNEFWRSYKKGSHLFYKGFKIQSQKYSSPLHVLIFPIL